MTPRKNKGLSMIIGILFILIIVLSVAITQFISLRNFNLAANVAENIENEKRQERIYITSLANETTGDDNYIKSITVKNTGSITVQLRSLYIDHTFLFDPSDTAINPNGGQIGPNSSKIVLFTGLVPRQLYKPESLMTVSTTRGTRSMVYENFLQGGNETIIEVHSNFGPLKLNYDEFYYAKYLSSNQIGPWTPGWSLSTKEGPIVWKINVTNIDSRDIILNATSCFVLTSITSPSKVISWYINATSPIMIRSGENATIVYKSKTDTGGDVNSPPGTVCQCKVFLAFFGSFQPEGKSYAQTIPFQSVDVFK